MQTDPPNDEEMEKIAAENYRLAREYDVKEQSKLKALEERAAEKRELVRTCTRTHFLVVLATLVLTGGIQGRTFGLLIFIYAGVEFVLAAFKFRKVNKDFKWFVWFGIAVLLAVVGASLAYGLLTWWMIFAWIVIVFVIYHLSVLCFGDRYFTTPSWQR